MNSLNLCQFIGNLGRDPETRYTADGSAVANISIGCNWKTKSASGTEWIKVVAYGKLAEIMGEYLKKGARVYVSGRMSTRKWKDKDGGDRYTTEVVADQLLMLDGKYGTTAETATGEERPKRTLPEVSGSVGEMDDDIPF